MLIDTHCHLHDRQFFTEQQAEEMLARAKEKGIKKVVCIGTSHTDSMIAREFAANHENVYWTYGVHPENAGESWGDFSGMEPLRPGVVGEAPLETSSELPIAIGEVGLDYHYDGYDRGAQIRLFEKMLQLAVDNNLPVSFHVREAFEDFFAVVKNFPTVRGCVHSFTDSKKVLRKILETTDFYVGVNGLATYATLPTPPLERILLETDAPFLTPVPYRGIINEPSYIYNIAEWLSQKLGMDFTTVEKGTTKNAERLFRFSDTEPSK